MGFLCVLRGVWESGKTESRLCPVAKIVNAFFGLFSSKYGGLGRLAGLRFLEVRLDQGRLRFKFKGTVKNTNEMCCVTSVNIWNFVCQR